MIEPKTQFAWKELTTIGIFDIGPEVPEEITFMFAPRCFGNSVATRKDNFVFIYSRQLRDDIASCAIGAVALIWHSAITGKTLPWPSTLVIPIGQRHIDVKIGRRYLGPCGFEFLEDENTLLIRSTSSRIELVKRCALGTQHALQCWQSRALRRQLRREKPVVNYDLSAAQDHSRTPRKPRVKAGELLPQAERDAMLAEGDKVIRDIMGNEGGDK
jgi:hypothetical protein